MKSAEYIATDNHIRGTSMWNVIDTLSLGEIRESEADYSFLRLLEVLPGSIYKFAWDEGFQTLIVTRFVTKSGMLLCSVYKDFGSKTAFDSVAEADIVMLGFDGLDLENPMQFASLDAYAHAHALGLV